MTSLAANVSAARLSESSREIDSEGNGFEQWIVRRSFRLLRPICGMALAIVLLSLAVMGPAIYTQQLWHVNAQFFYLAIWYFVAATFFAAVCVAAWKDREHAVRVVVLSTFLAGGTALFIWFALISWFLAGDLSIYAIAMLCVGGIFCFPGPLRRTLVVLSGVVLAATIYLLDENLTLVRAGVVLNLIGTVVASVLIDGYMMANSRALFREKCLVERERARADNVLYNALPRSIADELKSNSQVKAEKFQRMTVLFADIVGFTKFSSSLPPDAVIHVLNEIFSTFDDLVDAREVEKIKTIGDAYMVVGKNDPQAVADLAIGMLQAMAAYNALNGVHFDLRLGMHMGPTVAGVIGLKRFLYDVWGDAVNVASRLETKSVPGKIHVSEAIFDELKDTFVFEDRGQVELKDKGSMHTYFLIERKPG